ncbi:MAG: DUF2867 domain-containing protein [Zavarzinia sp.]|nr:DUF2867 domain-containing protein [Zavarzinia sp.]
MRIVTVVPEPALSALLPGASYADAFRGVSELRSLDAPSAAKRIMGRAPLWVQGLMALRNVIVVPFGLRTRIDSAGPHLGLFPILSETARQVVLGLDDRHLDFRVSVEVDPAPGQRRRITVTTLVRPHNIWGRIYLRLILPFHKLIVAAMMAQAERA